MTLTNIIHHLCEIGGKFNTSALWINDEFSHASLDCTVCYNDIPFTGNVTNITCNYFVATLPLSLYNEIMNHSDEIGFDKNGTPYTISDGYSITMWNMLHNADFVAPCFNDDTDNFSDVVAVWNVNDKSIPCCF